PDRGDEFRGILERVQRGERVQREETTRLRKDGMRVEVALAVSPILDPRGQVIGATSIAHDITERKRIEQQLLHAALHDALTDLPNRAYLVEPVSFEGRDIVTTASVGVALSQPGYTPSQDLLHDADLAMYYVKQQGGARFQVFDVTMRESAQARASIEADLRNALERQEFRLVF